MFILIASLFGLIIGSFLNVCICRLPEKESISYPPSHCTDCKHRLGVWDLIPLVSYLSLKGKCRYCKAQISLQYPIIELLNGIGYGFAVYYFGFTIQALLVCFFISIMLVLTVIDLKYMVLPTSVIIVGSVGVLLIRGVEAYLFRGGDYFIQALLGGAIGYGLFASVYYIALLGFKKEGMGYGDVRYLGMVGLFTSPKLVCLVLFLSALIGSIWGGVLYLKHKESYAFPLGPSISIAAVIVLFWGERLIQWYMNLYIGGMR